jgi:hypothetical protein
LQIGLNLQTGIFLTSNKIHLWQILQQ